MELELKHLAGYLPYGLKCHCLGLYVEDEEENPIPLEVIICGLSNNCVEILGVKKTVTECFFINDVLPLLRPLSSLIKVIDVDGKSFIPIIELARLENGGGVFDYQIEKLLTEESGSIVLYYISSAGLVEFSYDPKFMTFTMMLRNKDESYKCDLIVNHQLEMFQKLHEWHFDIYGLIDKGLAIAIEN